MDIDTCGPDGHVDGQNTDHSGFPSYDSGKEADHSCLSGYDKDSAMDIDEMSDDNDIMDVDCNISDNNHCTFDALSLNCSHASTSSSSSSSSSSSNNQPEQSHSDFLNSFNEKSSVKYLRNICNQHNISLYCHQKRMLKFQLLQTMRKHSCDSNCSAFKQTDQSSAIPFSNFIELSSAAKSWTIKELIKRNFFKAVQLREVALLHFGIRPRENNSNLSKNELIHLFQRHICSDLCVTSIDQCYEVGLNGPFRYLEYDKVNFLLSTLQKYRNNKARQIKRKRVESYSDPNRPSKRVNQPLSEYSPNQKRNIPEDPDPQERAKRRRLNSNKSYTIINNEDYTAGVTEPEISDLDSEWPEKLPYNEKKKIISEFRDMCSYNRLTSSPCSFCGKNELQSKISYFNQNELDITLLCETIEKLRMLTGQQHYQAYDEETIQDDQYQVCHLCRPCIQKKKFTTIPLYSYANGCWIGKVPPELQGLTFLEEQCIARARSTHCTAKINAEYGPLKAKGNVCILPQEPRSLEKVLPPPINVLYDEVAVILVASDKNIVTEEILKKSPLLIRRTRILKALEWLKTNNPLYSDIEISYDRLVSQYPTHGTIPGIAVQQLKCNTSGTSDGSSYATSHNTTDVLLPSEDSEIPVSSSGVIDSDQVSQTLTMRKLEAIRSIKSGQSPFVKWPSGNETLNTSFNPKVYGYLWPTLFPYGVGMFEEPYRLQKAEGFRNIDMKPHVRHYLQLKDSRFQTHFSFIFIMMNIIQRRTTTFQSKLAFKKSWFPNVAQALDKIDVSKLDDFGQRLKRDPYAKAENETETAAVELIRYVNFISDHISGSTGEIQKMREEMRAVMRTRGLPHLFITINPADLSNPIAQLLAGRNINVDKIFDELSPNSEYYERGKLIAGNPVAGAKFFEHMMKAFIDVLLGCNRASRKGVFGKVNSYYGVVESQGRGALHCHFFIWLENGLAPNQVKEKAEANEAWKNKLFEWLEDIIFLDLPEETSPYNATTRTMKKRPPMCQCPHPDDPKFDEHRLQDLRNLLETTNQIHEHTATCYKHMPFTPKQLQDLDKYCRFNLPRKPVPITHIDEHGHIHIRCTSSNVNSYNDICVTCLRCNMDIKYVGSGTAALAMIEYVTNYIAKLSLDSSTVFAALSAALKSLSENPVIDPTSNRIDMKEQSRKVLLKTCNGMIGKRELSGQQVASFLCNIPNHFTNHTFDTIWWTRLLNFTAESVLEQEDSTSQPNENKPNENTQNDHYVLLESVAREDTRPISELTSPISTGLICDIYYRPPEFNHMCLWEIFEQYKMEKIPKKKSENNNIPSNSPTDSFRFHPNHPKYHTHFLKKRSRPITPVLLGRPIPRRDSEHETELYAIAMMTLFKPWSQNPDALLKDPEIPWCTAFDEFLENINSRFLTIINNMQLIYQCRDAAHDYSAQRRRMLAEVYELHRPDKDNISDLNDDALREAMETTIEEPIDIEHLKLDTFATNSMRSLQDIILSITETESNGFYECPNNTDDDALPTQFDNAVRLATQEDIEEADKAVQTLLKEKELHLQNRLDEAKNMQITTTGRQHNTNSSISPMDPYTSSLSEEQQQLKHIISSFGNDNESHSYKILCTQLINKYTLNREQTLAFLLISDHHARTVILKEDLPPLRLIIGGPGGTGKSQIFEAVYEFYKLLGHAYQLKITAPTGLAASNIGGSTLHSEASLCVSRKKLHSNTTQADKLKQNIENRFYGVNTLICDEIYFLGASDLNQASENICLARDMQDDPQPFGNLNLIFAGDPAQLPPPRAKTLYDYDLVKLYDNNQLNGGNDSSKRYAEGLLTWRQINKCVVLKTILRQNEIEYQDLLCRIRFGNGNWNDFQNLQQHILSKRTIEQNRKLLDVKLWLEDPDNATPLICYTNAVRDAHNFRSSKAFAQVTNQQFHVYYSEDTCGGGKKKFTLKNEAAEAAWNTSIKRAKDLSGRLPLIPGMPIFLTDNIATEIGLSNGSEGKLVGVNYKEYEGKRYATSVLVELKTYNNPQQENPHRVTLTPIKTQFSFSLPDNSTKYFATRRQIPIIPGFAYTAHNAQGRSMNRGCIDIQSSPNTACTYVMLSRIRTLSGLSILRPFTFDKISKHAPQDVRDELKRLDNLAVKTTSNAVETIDWYYN
jgi:hypothetical protein